MKFARFLFSTLVLTLLIFSSLSGSVFAATPDGYKVVRKSITVETYRSAPGYELTGDAVPSWMEFSRLELKGEGEVVGGGYPLPSQAKVMFPPISFGTDGRPDADIRLCQENVNFYYSYLNGADTVIIAQGAESKVDVVATGLRFIKIIDYVWSGAEGGYQIYLDLEVTITVPAEAPDFAILSLTLNAENLHECSTPLLEMGPDTIIAEIPGPEAPGLFLADEEGILIDPPCPEGVVDCFEGDAEDEGPEADMDDPETGDIGDGPMVDLGDKIPGVTGEGIGGSDDLGTLPINEVNGGACSLQGVGGGFTQWFWIGAFLLGLVPTFRRKK